MKKYIYFVVGILLNLYLCNTTFATTVSCTYISNGSGYASSGGSKSTGSTVWVGASGSTYYRGFLKFDISSIPDNATISQVKLYVNCTTSNVNLEVNILQMSNDPSSASGSTLYTDANDGTQYNFSAWDIFHSTVSNYIILNSSAKTDLQNKLSANWFAVGISPIAGDESQTYGVLTLGASTTLDVTYTVPTTTTTQPTTTTTRITTSTTTIPTTTTTVITTTTTVVPTHVIITDIRVSNPFPIHGGNITISVDTRNDGGAGLADIGCSILDYFTDEVKCDLPWLNDIYYSAGEIKNNLTFNYQVPSSGRFKVISKSWDNLSGSCSGQCCTPSGTPNPQDPIGKMTTFTVKAYWTIMAYLDGEKQDMIAPTFNVFNSLEKGAGNQYVNIIALKDEWGVGPNFGASIYKVKYDTDINAIAQYQEGVDKFDLGERNMGDPATLSYLVDFAKISYPADHYALMLVDHGAGWYGVSWDDSPVLNDRLTPKEISEVLYNSTSNGSEKIDLVYFDACLMSMIEVAYQIAPYVDYMVGYESLGLTWAKPYTEEKVYSDVLNAIDDKTTSLTLAQSIATKYNAIYGSDPITVSALNLNEINNVAGKIDQLAQSLILDIDIYKNLITEARSSSVTFDNIDEEEDLQNNKGCYNGPEDDFIDLYDFVDNILDPNRPFDQNVKSIATDLKSTMNLLVKSNYVGPATTPPNCSIGTWNFLHAKGVSIFFPDKNDEHFKMWNIGNDFYPFKSYNDEQGYDPAYLSFVADTNWDEFLNAYFNAIPTTSSTSSTTSTIPTTSTSSSTSSSTTSVVTTSSTTTTSIANLWSPMTSNTNSYLEGVWGSGSNNVFAVGLDGVLPHYNGSSWFLMNSLNATNLYGIWGSASNDVFSVGANGKIIHYTGSGNDWVLMTSNITDALHGVWGSSSSNVFSVGQNGTIIRYNGSTWSSKMSSNVTVTLFNIWGSDTNNVYAVGQDETILKYNGSVWSVVTHPYINDGDNLRGIWGSSSNNIFVVGGSGTILRYNGSAWSKMTSNTNEDLYGVWGSTTSNVFAVGDMGTILYYNGTTWSIMNSGTTDNLTAVWGNSANDVFAVGQSGSILHYTGAIPVTTTILTTSTMPTTSSTSSTTSILPTTSTSSSTSSSTTSVVTTSSTTTTSIATLVGWWKFDEGTGATAGDSAGTNAGTINGSTWTANGSCVNALQFNGTNNYIQLSNAANLTFGTGPFTIAAYIKTVSTDRQLIFMKYPTSNMGYSYGVFGGKVYLGMSEGSSDSSITSIGSVNDGAWHHVAGERDTDGTLRIYIDGVLDNTAPQLPLRNVTNTTGPRIGCDTRPPGSGYFNGVIDEVRVYNSALTQAAIQSAMNYCTPQAPTSTTSSLPTTSSTSSTTSTIPTTSTTSSTSSSTTSVVTTSSTTTTTVQPDSDHDGIPDINDNCPNKPNGPNLGTCSATSDNPGVNCTSDADCANGCSSNGLCIKDQRDADGDNIGDVCDNCPAVCNPQQLDANGNGKGDLCDPNPGCGTGCGAPACEQPCS